MTVEDALAEPLIVEMGLHFDPFFSPDPGPANGASDSLFHQQRPVMGTTAQVFLYAQNAGRASELFEAAFAEKLGVESDLSRYRSTRGGRESTKGPPTVPSPSIQLFFRS